MRPRGSVEAPRAGAEAPRASTEVPPAGAAPPPTEPLKFSSPAAFKRPLGWLDDLPLEKIDPYLVWALLSDFAGFGGPSQGARQLPFLVELSAAGAAAKLAKLRVSPAAAGAPTGGGRPLVQMPRSYRADNKTRFCTLRVAQADLPQLLQSPLVLRADLGVAGLEPAGAARGSNRSAAPAARRSTAAGAGWCNPHSPCIGIIDHGIAFLHRNFLAPSLDDAGAGAAGSRILRFWDQWDGAAAAGSGRPQPRGPAGWAAEPGFGYGRLLSPVPVAAADAQFALYRQLGYEPALRRAAHGTHVLDLAAGHPNPMSLAPAYPNAPAGAPAATDAAASLPIIAVQLPWLPDKDVSGASLGVHVLDGLRFIAEGAGKDRAVVVNISDGAMAGPHDGSSLLERALDEYLVDHPNVSLVIAAGNAFDAKAHATGTIAPRQSASLGWDVLPDDKTESFLEIWLAKPAALRIELTPPGGAQAVLRLQVGAVETWAPSLAAGHDPARVVAAGIHLPAVAIGSGQMVLLALRPTLAAAGRCTAPHGRWRVTLVSQEASRAIDFDAWVERDDPPFGVAGPRRQSSLCAGASDGARVTGVNTLNSIAGGSHTVLVGGYRRSDGAAADYSSCPSSGDEGLRPTVLAPSEDGVALPGLLAAGNASGSVSRMNGTSVAAPIVTRMIANALAGQGSTAPGSTRIQQALRAIARRGRQGAAVRHGGAPAQPDEGLRSGGGRVDPGAAIDLD